MIGPGDPDAAAWTVVEQLMASCNQTDMDAALRVLNQWLQLDLAALRQVDPFAAAEPMMEDICIGAVDGAALAESTWRRALIGDPLLMGWNAWQRWPDDPLIARERYQCILSLPLIDAHGAIVGALLLARRESLPSLASLRSPLRVVARWFSAVLQVRERLRQEAQIIDQVTHLPGRLLFNDRLASTLHQARRRSESFAVLLLDIEHFRDINQVHGRATGDLVLAGIGRRLRASVRAEDTVARYGGSGFAVVLRQTASRDTAYKVLAMVRLALRVPVSVSGRDISVSVRGGLAFWPDDASTSNALLQHADRELRSSARLQDMAAPPATRRRGNRRRLVLETELREALGNGQLRVYYQPQIDTHNEDIVGAEALVRWQHPQLGLINPGLFLPLAEDQGVILPIGEWVLRSACKDASRWRRRFDLPLRISVNLSASQLRRSDLAATVAGALASAALDPQALVLEITESLSVKGIPDLWGALRLLRDMGCSLAIDDFGTGHSSLDYIKRVPADCVKIDQSFVRNIGIDSDDEAIISATLSMARDLGREVVAEGVETEQQMVFLRDRGCQVQQGFLFCRPLPADDFELLLMDRSRQRA